MFSALGLGFSSSGAYDQQMADQDPQPDDPAELEKVRTAFNVMLVSARFQLIGMQLPDYPVSRVNEMTLFEVLGAISTAFPSHIVKRESDITKLN
jgi:hypothetical protein